jgi:hypothetical protein
MKWVNEIKKYGLILLISCLFACAAQNAYSQRLQQNTSLDPVQLLMQSALKKKPLIFSKHPHVKLYFNKFLILWKVFFKNLQTDEIESTSLEDQFNRYYHTVGAERKKFRILAATRNFSHFNKDVLKGMRRLRNWCLDMRDRIKYATTSYQRKMYMNRLYQFQREWYQKFFGSSIQELSADWAGFTTYYWRDNLTVAELAKLEKNKSAYLYLSQYYSIRFQYLKRSASAARKVRKYERQQGDPKKLVKSLKQELSNVKNALVNLKKLHPPKLFQAFNNLESKRLMDLYKDTSLLVRIEKGIHQHVSREKIDHWISEKDKTDKKMQQQFQKIQKTYKFAMQQALGEDSP